MKTKSTLFPIIAIIALFLSLVGCNQPHTTGEVEIKQDQTQSDMKKSNDLKTRPNRFWKPDLTGFGNLLGLLPRTKN